MAEEFKDNDESALALEIMDGRKCPNTKRQYMLKVEHFTKWLLAKHPDCIHDDEKKTINLGKVDKNILKQFFGHTCKKKDKNGIYLDPVEYHALQHVSGYKSAIMDYYSNMEVDFTEDNSKTLE